MDDGKKRGRAVAAKTTAVSNDSGGDAVPKKRGRPSKAPKKVKPPSGRGRGRPPKRRNIAKATDGEENAVNGVGDSSATAKKGKTAKQIPTTGKGRGRPKNPPKSDEDDKEEEEENDEEEGDDDDDDD